MFVKRTSLNCKEIQLDILEKAYDNFGVVSLISFCFAIGEVRTLEGATLLLFYML